jgi:ArsR family transcriptional regulator
VSDGVASRGVDELNREVFIRVMKSLSNETRVRILALLSEKPMSVYELSKILRLSYPLTFLHIKQLKDAGLLEEVRYVEKHGPLPAKYYSTRRFKISVTPDLIRELFGGD